MNVERVRELCLNHAHVEECTPFGDDNLVFKVGGKIFALLSLGLERRVNLKCDPERSVELRELYPEAVIPGYHMNKKHWNTIIFDMLDDKIISELITHAYTLVYNALPKKVKEQLS